MLDDKQREFAFVAVGVSTLDELFDILDDKVSISGDDNRDALPKLWVDNLPVTKIDDFYPDVAGMTIKWSDLQRGSCKSTLGDVEYNSRWIKNVAGRHVAYAPADILLLQYSFILRDVQSKLDQELSVYNVLLRV